jgi:hypothetical protein
MSFWATFGFERDAWPLSHGLVPFAVYQNTGDPVVSWLTAYFWETDELSLHSGLGGYKMFAGSEDAPLEAPADSLVSDPSMALMLILIGLCIDYLTDNHRQNVGAGNAYTESLTARGAASYGAQLREGGRASIASIAPRIVRLLIFVGQGLGSWLINARSGHGDDEWRVGLLWFALIYLGTSFIGHMAVAYDRYETNFITRAGARRYLRRSAYFGAVAVSFIAAVSLWQPPLPHHHHSHSHGDKTSPWVASIYVRMLVVGALWLLPLGYFALSKYRAERARRGLPFWPVLFRA